MTKTKKKHLSPKSGIVKNALARKKEGARITGLHQVRFDEPDRWMKDESINLKEESDGKNKESES